MDAPEHDPGSNPAAHCSDDDLALRALGEAVHTHGFDLHLAACGSCQSTLDQLRSVVRTGRAVTADDRLVAPPPTIWEGVARAVREDREPVARPLAGRRRAAPNRRTRYLTMAGGAVAAALVLTFALVVSPWQNDDGGTVTASITLAPIAPASAAGEAVMSSSAGAASMTVDVPGLPAADGFYEVWLMDGGSQLVSLGALDRDNRGSFQVPAGLDASKYQYVDVSLEPFDGNPGHSTESVVRGRLPA